MATAIRTPNELAWRVEIPLQKLERLARNAVRLYKPFKKYKKGKSKPRTIDNPDEELKSVQTRIYERILREVNLPPYLHGGVPGRSARTNAAFHLALPCAVRIDVRSFFPTVTDFHVFNVWVKEVNCAPPVARILTPLTTLRGYLPQGAPSSTALANLVLLSVDERLRFEADLAGVNYSRFVDDLVFSGSNPRDLINGAISALRSAGFSVSRRKIRIMPHHKAQLICGYNVNSSRSPSVPRTYRSAVRAEIHRIKSLRPNSMAYCTLLASIRGKISYIRQTNPGSAENLESYLTKVVAPGNAVLRCS